jgi:ubiquinone/menaquinone biosynthesis C-methylase UbiE
MSARAIERDSGGDVAGTRTDGHDTVTAKSHERTKPMSRHEQQNAAIRDQFSKQAQAYARLTRSRSDPSFIRLAEALRLTDADRALDVGCGTGIFSLSLAGRAEQVTGIDLTPEMLDQARALQAELNINNIDWRQGDILPLPFANESFSIVVTKATFHHLVDPAAVLAQMKRVCKPGGRISVTDMTPDPTKAAAFDAVEKLRDPSHLHVLSAQQLRDLGQEAGLRELAFWQVSSVVPLEAVLATSFPEPGDLARVRAHYREDVASGQDRLGMSLREENGDILVSYPMTTVVWEKP